MGKVLGSLGNLSTLNGSKLSLVPTVPTFKWPLPSSARSSWRAGIIRSINH